MLYHQKSTIKFPKKNVIDEYKEYEEALVRCFKGTQKWSDVRLLVKALQDKDNEIEELKAQAKINKEILNSQRKVLKVQETKLNAIKVLLGGNEFTKKEILQIINGEDNETP